MYLPMPIVSTKWLSQHLGAPDVKIIDASWRLDGGAPPARAAYEKAHLPGARFFDIDAIADQTSQLPHMLPAPVDFSNAVSAMGISNQDAVIVYDQDGVFSAPRVWWTFRAMGHERVAVLDGGLPKWRGEGRHVDVQPVMWAPEVYAAQLHKALVASHEDVRSAQENSLIFDARPAARFQGAAPEPRAGLRSGAMPGAVNIPATALIASDGTLKPQSALRAVFDEAGLDDRPVVTTCGSGVTAAIIALGLACIGHDDWRLYDGSWAEWGREEKDPELFPVVGERGERRHDAED